MSHHHDPDEFLDVHTRGALAFQLFDRP